MRTCIHLRGYEDYGNVCVNVINGLVSFRPLASPDGQRMQIPKYSPTSPPGGARAAWHQGGNADEGPVAQNSFSVIREKLI